MTQSAVCRKVQVGGSMSAIRRFSGQNRPKVKEMTRLLLILAIAISLVGCTTGSGLSPDQVYPTIEDHTAVSILMEMPEGAEQIAVLKASSGWGSSYGQFPENAVEGQKRRAAAVEDLQRRAAKVGANAVVLTDLVPSVRDGTPTARGWTAILFRTQIEIVEGIAIFIR